MRRLLVILIFATSLAGCIGTVWLWGRSLATSDMIKYHENRWIDIDFLSSAGGLALSREYQRSVPPRPNAPDQVGGIATFSMDITPVLNRRGVPSLSERFMWYVGTDTSPNGTRYNVVRIMVPHFVPLAAFAPGVLWPAWRFIHHRTRRRRLLRAGYCVNCGYDLRASPERCPECGTRCPNAIKGVGYVVNAPAHNDIESALVGWRERLVCDGG